MVREGKDSLTRETKQRAAILKAIQEAKRPLLSKEILELAEVHSPKLGLATIYRNIKRLLQEGAVEEVLLPGRSKRYAHTLREGKAILYCKYSGRAEYVELPGVQVALPEVPRHFALEGHQIVMYGQFVKEA